MNSHQTSKSVSWDYSALARPYLKRPEYSEGGIDAMLALVRLPPQGAICDIGAGVGHLTIPLARRGGRVTAVEPNDAMRALGVERTRDNPGVVWVAGTGEETGLPASAFDFVTFGSSFNVVDRARGLAETRRLLRPGGWFACMWNHRNLDDPIQADVEAIIQEHVVGYGYGARREDQAPVIVASGLFDTPFYIEAPIRHRVAVDDWVEAWRSHATLDRQSDGRLNDIVDAIGAYFARRGDSEITVPYTTRIWAAQATG